MKSRKSIINCLVVIALTVTGCTVLSPPNFPPTATPIDLNSFAATSIAMAFTQQAASAQPVPSDTPKPSEPLPTLDPTLVFAATAFVQTAEATPAPIATDVSAFTATPSPNRQVFLAPYEKDGSACSIAGARLGIVSFFDPGNGALKGTVELSGLEQNHLYTLNLTPQDSGPTDVLKSCSNPGESHCDFQDLLTTDSGGVTQDFELPLDPGTFHAKFFVKDAATYCNALFKDNFEFEIK